MKEGDPSGLKQKKGRTNVLKIKFVSYYGSNIFIVEQLYLRTNSYIFFLVFFYAHLCVFQLIKRHDIFSDDTQSRS